MGEGGCETALAMAREMFFPSCVARLVPFQRQPLVLTDQGLSHDRFRPRGEDAM